MSDISAALQDPSKRKWFIIGGGAIAAFLVYKYVKGKSATSTAGTPASGTTADTTDSTIDPTTGIPYSEEYGTAGAYGAIPSGLTFDAATGQFEPAASTIIGDVPYSTQAGQSATATAPSDPNALASNFLSAYAYNAGQPGGAYYGVTTAGETVHLTPAEQLALAGQNYQFGSYTGPPNSSPIPATKTTNAVPQTT